MAATARVPGQVSDDSPAVAPRRSVRRATARRASTRRAYARSRQSDSEARIIACIAQHPGSTVGDLARRLNLHLEHVASDLSQLTSTGEITKTAHGYSIEQPATPEGD
jgi:predicted transcriptional regulator